MTTETPPPPGWLAGLRALVQPVAGALPALVVVLFAGGLALAGLFCRKAGRDYVIECTERLIRLAAVIVGAGRTPPPRKKATG